MKKNINFIKLSFFITAIIFLAFLSFNPTEHWGGFIASILGSISTSATLYLIFLIVLFIPFLIIPRITLVLAGFIFAFTNLMLVLDFFIYRLYNYHINAMVLNILTSLDALEALGIGLAPFILAIVLFVVFLLLELVLYKIQHKKIATFIGNKSLAVYLLLIIIVEKATFAGFSLMQNYLFTANFNPIPLYQPLTIKRLAHKYFDYKLTDNKSANLNVDAKHLNYPRKPLVLKPTSYKPFNVFVFMSDSVRRSAVTPDVAPNISKFAKENYSLDQHYSGGNATRFGVFSLFYGINSSYWFKFLEQQKSPILLDTLKKLNYQTSIITSASANWPEFRQTAFVSVKDDIKDDFNGVPYQKDQQSTQAFLDTLDTLDPNKPIFSFLFWDAPHGLSYPPEFAKFEVKKDLDYLNVSADRPDILDGMYKSYKNAIYFNDDLFAKMIKTLKDKGLYDNSLIIYTADHGHEFYEYGSFGHNSAFDEAQTRTPFIFKLPDSLKEIAHIPAPDQMTSHLDFPATVLQNLGVTNDYQDYTNGQNMFAADFKRDDAVVYDWNNMAIITKKLTYIFSNKPNKLFENNVRDNATYKKTDEPVDQSLVIKVINENHQFAK